MPRVLSDRGIAWLEDIPPQFRSDPDIKASIDVQAREFDRYQLRMDAITAGYFPPLDEDGVYLAIWEALMKISVNPGGYTSADRLARDVAFIQQLGAGATGTAFEASGRSIVGPGFTYREHMDAIGLAKLTNYITNPKAAVNTTGWSIQGLGGEVLGRTTSPAGTPPAGFTTAFTGTASTINTRWHHTDLAVVAGDVVRFSGWVCRTTGGNLSIRIAEAAPSNFAVVNNVTVTPTINTWQWVDVTFVVTTQTSLHLYLHSDTVSQGIQWTGMLATKNGTAVVGPSDYFDGDKVGYDWTGTANASTSTPENPPDNTIRIDLGLAATSQQAQDTYNLMRAVLPAHIALSVNYGVGFVVGISHVGVDAL